MTFVDDAQLRSLLALAAPPEVIADRFEIGALLGEGGMGIVFEAWDREGQRSVALKLLREADEATSARFDREATALAALSHPGIVGYVAHGSTAQGQRYLALEQLTGVTLAARLAEGPLDVQDAARIGHGVAAALAAAHEHGLVHRDIKPSNIFLQDGDAQRVKLLDFGLARAADAAAVTRSGSLVGTPSYMAPEQVRAATLPDARSDLFALGAVLFECLTGRAPFVGSDTEAVLVKILVEQPPAVRQLCPAVPAAFEALLARLLAKEPERRPADAAQVTRELAVFASVRTEVSNADRAPDSDAGDPAQPGTLIAGKYRVVRTLGSGGMGVVLLARHAALDRNVAIKLLHGSASGNGSEPSEDNMARLLREARAASRLESEHVARVMDVGRLDAPRGQAGGGAPFIVMEFLSGKDLAQVLRDRKRLPVDVVLDYVLQAGEALAEAHALGIVHRDLKPSNLFLTTRRDGSPLIKVLDFGISKLAPASPELSPGEASITAPDAILGSPLYMSPEQLQSAKRVDVRTDIWSLGVVLQELLTGRPPFVADSFLGIGAQIAAGEPAELRAGCPEAPEDLAAVVRRCLAKDPAQRFSSIAQLAQALGPYAPASSRLSIERIIGVARENSAATPTQLARERGQPRRRAALLVGIAAALALGAALLVRGRSAPLVAERALSAASSTSAPAPPSAEAPSPVLQSPVPQSPVLQSPVPPGPLDAGEGSSSATLTPSPPPAVPAPVARKRAQRAAPPGERRATPAAAGSRATGPLLRPVAPRSAPADAVDPLNPALLRR